MRLNWFSPLPPARTEIANYTARLLPALSTACEFSLWTDQPETGLALKLPVAVQQFTADRPPWGELNQADVNVYHIGNNPRWHTAIWKLSRQQPGVVVLHETGLTALFLEVFEQANDWGGFLQQAARHYGPPGVRSATAFREGKTSIASLSAELPLTELATRNALGVLVHSRGAFDCVRQSSSVPVMCASLPHAPRVPPPSPVAHRRKYTGAGPFRLLLFGHIGVNRRLEAVLQALGSFPARNRFHFDIYGDMNQQEAVEALVRDLSLESLVRIHGFVPEPTLTAALREAHLAINLRFPTMGEASASQLRIWDHALPSLVTPVGWYAHLPPDAVSFVRPEHEISDLHALLTAFLQDPTRFAAQGLEGRKILEECHGVQAYVQQLVAFASACGRNRGCLALRGAACRAAAELVNAAGPRGAALGFDALTAQILALRGKLPSPLEQSNSQADSAPARSAA